MSLERFEKDHPRLVDDLVMVLDLYGSKLDPQTKKTMLRLILISIRQHTTREVKINGS
jgi:hypothetical protein